MKIKEIKIVNQDESTEVADIGADAINVNHTDTNVKLKLDKLSNDVDTNTTNISNEITTRANSVASLQSQIRGLASGSPKGSYANAAAIVSANPDTGVYIAQDNGHIYSWTKNGSSAIDLGVYQAIEVQYEHNQFYENNIGIINNKGDNIFNNDNSSNGVYPNIDGNLSKNQYYEYSDYLPVKPAVNHVINNYTDNIFYGYYDINKKWISREHNILNFTTPENCYYIRVAYNKRDKNTLVIVESETIPETLTDFTDFIRNIPVIKNLPHAHLLRGSMYVSAINKKTKEITIHVSSNTILYTENNFGAVPTGDYSLPTGHMLVFNLRTLKLETIPLSNQNVDNVFYNKMMYVCTNFDTIVLTDKNTGLNKRVVNKFGLCDYGFISDAYYTLPANGIIEIHEGGYPETLECWDKDVNLIGIGNPENIIIFNSNGNYSTPPLEMCGGSIQNLTLYAKYDGTTPTEEWSSYAMHIETDKLVDKRLLCKDVIFKSDFNYCIGIGLRKGADLEFNNCKFINTCDYSNTAIPTKGGAIYFHDAHDGDYAGECFIAFINCLMTMEGTTESSNRPLIKLQQVESQNTYPVHVTFINNSTWDKANNNAGSVWNTGHTGSIENGDWLSMKDWKLSLYSHGNNYNILNHS